ncbi:MAG: alpha/beta hydrolase [Myxococcales bacterium]|nr:alpha/beta hydrolase [Myxococcales bacterium]
MPTLDVGGQRVSYREQGSARPPLLLVHGAGASSRVFAEVCGPLARTHWTLAVDLPGHGRSAPWREPVAFEQLIEREVELLADFGERIGLGRFVLAGHSMGGAVALHFALRYPDRLAGLALIATGAVLRVHDAVFQVIERKFDEMADLLAATGYSPLSNAREVEAWARQTVAAPQQVTLDDYRACHRHDVRERLGEIALPTVVVSGSDDRLTAPKLQQRLVDGIARARLHSVTRAGHMVVQERPDEVVEALRSLPLDAAAR